MLFIANEGITGVTVSRYGIDLPLIHIQSVYSKDELRSKYEAFETIEIQTPIDITCTYKDYTGELRGTVAHCTIHVALTKDEIDSILNIPRAKAFNIIRRAKDMDDVIERFKTVNVNVEIRTAEIEHDLMIELSSDVVKEMKTCYKTIKKYWDNYDEIVKANKIAEKKQAQKLIEKKAKNVEIAEIKRILKKYKEVEEFLDKMRVVAQQRVKSVKNINKYPIVTIDESLGCPCVIDTYNKHIYLKYDPTDIFRLNVAEAIEYYEGIKNPRFVLPCIITKKDRGTSTDHTYSIVMNIDKPVFKRLSKNSSKLYGTNKVYEFKSYVRDNMATRIDLDIHDEYTHPLEIESYRSDFTEVLTTNALISNDLLELVRDIRKSLKDIVNPYAKRVRDYRIKSIKDETTESGYISSGNYRKTTLISNFEDYYEEYDEAREYASFESLLNSTPSWYDEEEYND